MKQTSGGGGVALEGWALNLSRGGVRVILEAKLELGADLVVCVFVGTVPPTPYNGRVVWVQEEVDGVVCGIEFRGLSQAVNPSAI